MTDNSDYDIFDPKPAPVSTPATRSLLMGLLLAIVLILAAVVTFLRGKPAPSYPPLEENAVIASPTP